MPVKIPDSLPARATLEKENIFVMTEKRASTQDIRPLKLLILNLMPLKTTTETSLLRRLSNTPLQIEVDFLRTATYTSRNASKSYLEQFYKTFSVVEKRNYDGLIITGAPIETLEFEEVDYWGSSVLLWSGLKGGSLPPSSSVGGPKRASTTTTKSLNTP